MKLFYYDAYLDEELEFSDLKELDINRVLDYFYELTSEEGSFIGLIDDNDNCIQFAWESQDKWLVDVPNPPEMINFQKYADYDTCSAIIKKIFKQQQIKKTDDMIKVDILKQTLDDAINKK